MSGYTPQDAVERGLAAARSDDCLIIADESSAANVRWAGNTLTTNGVSRSRQLTVIAINRAGDGTRAGMVSRSGVTADQVPDLVAAAEQLAYTSSPAEDAQPLITPAEAGAHLSTAGELGWAEPPVGTDIDVLTGFARDLREAFDRAGSDGHKLYGYAQHRRTSSYLGTSAGLRLRHDQPSGKVELNAKSENGSAWAGQGTASFADVDVLSMQAELTRRLSWGKRQVDLPAGRYQVLLPPGAVSDLLIYMYWSAGARDAADGRTVFSKAGGATKVGERLASLPLTLGSDPAAPGLECAPFVIAHASGRTQSIFDNGFGLAATDWISGGTLTSLVQTRHSADLTGLPVTPQIGNLIMRSDGPTAASLDDMIARTDRGLLLTCLWYIREVDPQTLLLTGLTRDGVYLVENGEVTAAVNNFRFNESPVGMLGRITEVGPTSKTLPREWSEYFTRTAMPPVRVDGFNMSSVSQAS